MRNWRPGDVLFDQFAAATTLARVSSARHRRSDRDQVMRCYYGACLLNFRSRASEGRRNLALHFFVCSFQYLSTASSVEGTIS